MIATPWGDSETLRTRMLRPGPGALPEQVAANQRERILGALVASVAARGYAATRVSDLVELSGVSSRSFYDLFGDKDACFRAALEAVLRTTIELVGKVEVDGEADWEELARRRFEAFAAAVVAQPAAAKLCLVDAPAAGPEAVRIFERAIDTIEALAREGLAHSPERAAMPDAMISAHVGAMLEIVRNRLRWGRESELPGLGTELVDLMLAYRPPTAPLRQGGRGPAPAEVLDAHDHAERALRAFEALVAEQGYAATTMDQVLKRASMSTRTLYGNFRSKQELLAAAIDSASAQIVAAVMPAVRRFPTWSEGVRAALGALLSFLASRPALARLVMVEVYAAGSEALGRRQEMLAPLEALIAEGQRHSPGTPAIAAEAIIGAIFGLADRTIRASGPEALPARIPICTYIALAPFLGPEGATAAANREGKGRGPIQTDHDSFRAVAMEPRRARALMLLAERAASPAEIAGEMEKPVEEIAAQIAELEKAGLVEAIEGQERAGDDGGERMYRSTLRMLDDEDWPQFAPAERHRISYNIDRLIRAEIDYAFAVGSFDARVDRHLTRMPLWVDEQGWRELGDIHAGALDATVQVQERARARLRESGEKAVSARSVLVLFELP
jgi:AcrR family transcriptional regulator/DNA-binding transcriptional ArsR family regulator